MSDNRKHLSFNKHDAKLFVRHYNKAKTDKKESFFFKGDEYVTDFAYYVIQYLEMNQMLSGKFDDNKKYNLL